MISRVHVCAVLFGLIIAGPTAGQGQSIVHDRPDLTDVNALTVESDFSVFMRQGVSEDLRRAALRRLWVLMEFPVQCHDHCYDTEPAASDFAQLDKVLASAN